MWQPTGLTGAPPNFVNIGRNVVVASKRPKSEGWCALSPYCQSRRIHHDHSRNYTKVEENSHNPVARRKHVVDVYYMYRLAATRTPQGTSEAWHLSVDHELLL